jgi:hypothetical protein
MLDLHIESLLYEGRAVINDEHWVWLGNTTSKGYPKLSRFIDDHWRQDVRRDLWEVNTGEEIPPDAMLTNVCGVKLCFNPKHQVMAYTHSEYGFKLSKYLEYFEAPTGCWIWRWPPAISTGYPLASRHVINHREDKDRNPLRIKKAIARRVLYTEHRPHENITGKILKSTCDNKRCVNPDHMLVFTSLKSVPDHLFPSRAVFSVPQPKNVHTRD